VGGCLRHWRIAGFDGMLYLFDMAASIIVIDSVGECVPVEFTLTEYRMLLADATAQGLTVSEALKDAAVDFPLQ
jgi:hypothetical protein